MVSQRQLPEGSRVSILTVTILLAYALTRIVHTPDFPLVLTVGGVVVSLNLNLNIAFTVLAAGLAATGTDWLLRGHPTQEGKSTVEHLLLPLLTALVVGVALFTLPAGTVWWLGFAVGALLLTGVFFSEYIVVDSSAILYPVAAMALTALSFALYLILTIALCSAGARLFFMAPALFLAGVLAALRTFHLRLGERWEFSWAVGVALIGTQLAAALHYWPLTPVQFGLILLGPVYALTSLAVGLLEELPFRRAVIEPLIMLGLMWGLAIFFR